MNIDVDISGVLPFSSLDLGHLRDRVALLAEMARGEWIRLAQINLRSSAADYIAGIQPVVVNGNWAMITLVGQLPNDIENGKNPFDMKPGLLTGPHAKTGRGGNRFNTVPFRHGTPGTTGKRVGQPMPYTGRTAAGRRTSLIYSDAKKLRATMDGPGGKTVWGARTGDFGGYGRRTQLPVIGGRPGAYTWKNSPYAGMYRIQKVYRNATQYQYVTFRRVSDNSDPNSWWHPGITGRHFALRVANYVKEQVDRLV